MKVNDLELELRKTHLKDLRYSVRGILSQPFFIFWLCFQVELRLFSQVLRHCCSPCLVLGSSMVTGSHMFSPVCKNSRAQMAQLNLQYLRPGSKAPGSPDGLEHGEARCGDSS